MKLEIELVTGSKIYVETDDKTLVDFIERATDDVGKTTRFYNGIDTSGVPRLVFFNQIVQISEVKPVGNISFQIDGVELARYGLSQDSFNKQIEHNQKMLKDYYGAMKTSEEMKKEAQDLFNWAMER